MIKIETNNTKTTESNIKRILNRLKNPKVLLLAAIFLISFFIFNSRKDQQVKENIDTTNKDSWQQPQYQNIEIGKTSESQLINLLGTPINKEAYGNYTTYEYKSRSLSRNTLVKTEDGKVNYVKQIITDEDGTNLIKLQNLYGKEDYILYNQLEPNDYFKLYVYLDLGFAFIAHDSGRVIEMWYFLPTSYENFIKTWGSIYGKDRSKLRIQ